MADAFGLTQAIQSIGLQLDTASITTLADILRQVKLGTHLTPLKVTFTGMASSATQQFTSAANFAFATVNQGPVGKFAAQGVLPAALSIETLRVVTGAGQTGPVAVTDSGGTAVAATVTYAGTALISDDGTTLTFAGAVTAMVMEYIPRAAVNLGANFDDFNQTV